MRSALLNTPWGASEMGKDYLWGAYHCLGLGPENPSPDSWSFMCCNWTPWRSTSPALHLRSLCGSLHQAEPEGVSGGIRVGYLCRLLNSHSWTLHIQLLGPWLNISIQLPKRKTFKKPLFTCAGAQRKRSGVSRRFPRLIEINSAPLVNCRK